MGNDATKEVDAANPDEKSILKTLEDRAVQSLEADLLESASQLGVTQAAYVATRTRLMKLIYQGGCPRDLSAQCPEGWTTAAAGCIPPDDYAGRCGVTSFANLATAGQKEGFARDATPPGHARRHASGISVNVQSLGRVS